MKTSMVLLIFLIRYIHSDHLESDDIKKKEPKYLFTAPKTLTEGQNETVCLSTYQATVPIKVLLDLKIREKHHTMTHILHAHHDCFQMFVPILRNNIKDAQYASLHLQVQLNGTIYSGHNQEPLLIYPNHNIVFIEMDKNLYRLGDKVRIRILILTQDIKAPEKYIIPSIKILNPSGITVTVWENIPTELGFVQLEHQLAQDTTMGQWKVEINDIMKTFQVKHHVLPRFKIILKNSNLIYAATDKVKFTVCGKYAFGQNVKGVAMLKIGFSKNSKATINAARQLINGCVDLEFSSEELHLHEQVNGDLRIVASVAEHGTSRIETETGKSQITNQAYTMAFGEDDKHFQPGLPYYGKVKASNVLIPLADEIVEICYNIAIDKSWNIKDINQCSNFKFGHDNIIYFTIPPVKDNIVQIRLFAKSLNQTIRQEWSGKLYPDKFSDEVSAYFALNRWHSSTNTYIQLDRAHKGHTKCKAAQHFSIYYTTEKFKENENITFHYMIRSRNKIFRIRNITHSTRKQHTINYNELKNIIGTNHTYTKIDTPVDKCVLKFKLDNKIITKYQLIVYYVSFRGEVVAASIDVNVEKCLLNKVETNWSNHQYYPGEKVSVTIKTAPHSLCAISAVDNSVTFSSSSTKPLNIHALLKPFLMDKPVRKSNKLNCLTRTPKKIQVTTTTSRPEWDLKKKRRRRSYQISPSDQFDSFEAFNSFGVLVITNLKLISKPCLTEAQFLVNPQKEIYYDVHTENRGTQIRSFFPETWLWELVPVGEQQTKLVRDLPHTITNWISNTLCVSPTLGVGISPIKEITVFQPFFLEVLTPHSIKRGEVLHLEVILHNYLNYSIPVRITLGESDGLELPEHSDERSEMHCISDRDSKSVRFSIRGTKLGKFSISVLAEVESSYPGECGPEVIINKRDVVIKDILVEPEGHPVDDVKSTLLCTNDAANANNVTWSLEFPNDVIPNSAQAKLIANADLLGPTIHHLEKLLLVPTGCGEQIMATLAPNLYVLQYLNATGRLTSFWQQRIKRNLKIGYQRILEYIHSDGSFSAFGYHDTSGSMFLTAFVIRTLQQSKPYIYIDPNIIDKAVKWILAHQLENGCFATISHVFHDMGGTSTENSTAALTSYVIISLLESGINLTEKVLTNAQYCIRGHFSPDKYTLAISTYALSLIGWESEATRSLHRLMQVATRDKNFMWWSSSDSHSINIEMTAYVLMSLLLQNTTENLVSANSIVRWLASQRGPNGGFVTTQDTVVALNAITKYAMLIHSKDADLHINISTDNENYEVTINAKDRLKAKQQLIKRLPTTVDVAIDGEGCVLVQAHLHYNLNHIINSEAFKLAVAVDTVSTTDQCSVAMVSPCVSYTGPDLHSNMAVLEVTMPSGYEPDRASLFKLIEESNSKVKKFEESENQVILYFTELNNEPICVPFNINENSKVDARIEATIKLYDYYNPELKILQTYEVNKCLPNEIAPIPPLPVNKINNLTNDQISENKTENSDLDVIDVNGSSQNIIKRHVKNQHIKIAHNTGLNPDFVNKDIEMSMPEGSEGNRPVYMKPHRKTIINN